MMTRKVAAILAIALALSVACLGVFLALRCQRCEKPVEAVPAPQSLTIGNDLNVE
jgi:hypothetical protein